MHEEAESSRFIGFDGPVSGFVLEERVVARNAELVKVAVGWFVRELRFCHHHL